MLHPLVVHFGGVILLVALAVLAGRLARRPEISHALWLLVFLKLLVPPLLDVPVLPAAETGPSLSVFRSIPGDVSGLDPSIPLGLDTGPIATADIGGPTTKDILIFLWITGSVLGLVAAAFSTIRFHRAVRRSTRAPVELESLARRLAVRLGLSRCPRLVLVDLAIAPAVWPTIPATLLLPGSLMSRLTDQELEAVLLHELVHYQRRDHWVRVPELLALCVYWWLPVVWWLRRQLRFSEEACCDHRVLQHHSGDRRSYAEALLKTAGFLAEPSSRTLPRTATGIDAVKPLARRLTMIMQHQPTRPLSRTTAVLAFGGLLALLPLMPTEVTATVSPSPAGLVAEGPEGPAIEPAPRDEERDLKNLARIAIRKGDFTKATVHLYRLLEIGGADATSYGLLGQALGSLGDHDAAESAYLMAIALDPGTSDWREGLLRCLFQQNRHRDAAALARKMIEETPDRARLHQLLARAYMALGQPEKAAESLQRASELDDRPLPKMQPPVDPVKALQERLKRDPTDGETLLILGLVHEKRGELARASQYYLRAAELDGYEANAHLRHAVLLVKSKRYEEAIVFLRRSLGHDPNADVRRYLEQVEKVAAKTRRPRKDI